MRRSARFLTALVFLFFSELAHHEATAITLLHEFAGGDNDGRRPNAGLTLNGSALFGTTKSGGDNDLGTIFSINTNGTGFTLLHEFAGGANDGEQPHDLTLSGSTLFGTTLHGGNNNDGTIFSINTDGSDFMLLHEFAGGPNDGQEPPAGLALSGSILFGTTNRGGANRSGTIFSIPVLEPGGLVLIITALCVLGFYPMSRRVIHKT